ncbi:MAG: DUF3105 domain-containing protein [Candidatus Dormiibacterota bacterium]
MASRKNQAKQVRLDARAAQIKAQAQREARTRNIVIAVFVVLIVGGSGALYFLNNPPSFLTGNNSSSTQAGAAYDVADEGHNHVPDGTQVAYKHLPPSSGDHYSSSLGPLPWNTYNNPVQPESFVHNLEHGGVVMVYKCTGTECDAMYKQAQDVFSKLPPKLEPVNPQGAQQIQEVKFLSTPYQGMSPKVALLAWDKEQDISSIDLATIQAFYTQYGDHGREDLP